MVHSKFQRKNAEMFCLLVTLGFFLPEFLFSCFQPKPKPGPNFFSSSPVQSKSIQRSYEEGEGCEKKKKDERTGLSTVHS